MEESFLKLILEQNWSKKKITEFLHLHTEVKRHMVKQQQAGPNPGLCIPSQAVLCQWERAAVSHYVANQRFLFTGSTHSLLYSFADV